jgi:hypothetical protein
MHLAADNIVKRDCLARKLETPVGLTPLRLKACTLLIRKLERGTVIDRRPVLRELSLATAIELLGRLIAGIKSPHGPEPVSSRIMRPCAIRLSRKHVMVQPKPCKILQDAVGKSFRRSLGVRIVKPKKKAATSLPCKQPVGERGTYVADMKLARWAGRKAHDIGHAGPHTSCSKKNSIRENSNTMITSHPGRHW